jgi:hypothetical protein
MTSLQKEGTCDVCGQDTIREKGVMQSLDRSVSDDWVSEPYELLRCGCGLRWMDLEGLQIELKPNR